MNVKYFLVLLAAIAFSHSVSAQELSASDFVETDPPKPNSKEWIALNWMLKDFKIINNEGKLQIMMWQPSDGNIELKTQHGTLIGVDRGEWGGYLLFVNDQTHKTDTVTYGNIHLLFEYDHDIYFIDALAHMTFNSGTLYKLKFMNGKYFRNKVVSFEDAPQVVCIFNNDLLVASFSSFYRIHNSQKETIFKNEFWQSLYPSSLTAVDAKDVYMGIRGGYVKLDLLDKRYVFYKYKGQ